MFQFSFLLPTRERPELVNRLIQSIIDTTNCIEDIEIILCVDDDLVSRDFTHDSLFIKKVIVQKGSTMGFLNRACFDASSGRYLVIMNDDVIIRTKNWDKVIAAVFSAFDDNIALIHVDDLLFRDRFCTFPILSRKACLEIGICPAEYMKYRIDDHIYDTYNILAYLGHRRIVYLPEVVFEHDNRVRMRRSATNQIFDRQVLRKPRLVGGVKGHNIKKDYISGKPNPVSEELHFDKGKVRLSNKEVIESDLYIFNEKLEERKENALKLARLIDNHRYEEKKSRYVELLKNIQDPYGYRRSDFVTKIDPGQYRIVKNHSKEAFGRISWSSDPKTIQYSTNRSFWLKVFALLRLNRSVLSTVLTTMEIVREAFNRYYFRLPGFVRKFTDGLVSKLVKIYRAIIHDGYVTHKP